MPHHNAPAHTSLLIREFLAKHKMTLIPQLPYSPDLAPANFFFVPEVEIHSKRSPISDNRRDRRNFAKGPMRYPAKQNAFQNCKKRWERCIHSGGEYF
jgi:hypothetical protein